jgi:hypothetical protein
MELLREFEWPVVPCKVIEVEESGVRAWALLPNRGRMTRTYRPLSAAYATLWRTFAVGSDHSATRCLALATEFGLLGDARPLPLACSADLTVVAEDQFGWERHLTDLSHAALVFDEIENGDGRWFDDLFEWDGRRLYLRDDQGGARPFELGISTVGKAHGEGPGRTEIARFPSGRPLPQDGTTAAKTYLQLLVNEQLRRLVSTTLELADDGRRQRLRFGPTNLLGALWLQLALAIASGATIVECRECGRPFEISKSLGLRADAQFCSDPCKSRNYRRRKRLARQWAAEGLEIPEIVRLVGSTPETVARWIAGTPRQN